MVSGKKSVKKRNRKGSGKMIRTFAKKMVTAGLSFILAAGFVLGGIIPERIQAAETENADTEFSIHAFPNLDYTLQTIAGNEVSTKVLPSKDVTMLVFGRTTCGSTWITLKSIAESEWIYDPKVSVIYIDIDGADTEVIQGTIEQYSLMCKDEDLYYRGCEQIVFCHDADEKNEEVRYQYHFRSGKWGTISLPMIMLIDKNNIVREMLTGAQAADKILPVMNHVVEAGNAEEEDKKDNTGKDDTEKDDDGNGDNEKDDAGNKPATDGNVSKPNGSTLNSNDEVQAGKSAKCKVKSIKISAPKKKLRAGKSMKLKADVRITGSGNANTKLKWSSSKKKYAAVNQKGIVKAKKAGRGKTVTITAMATDGTGIKAKIKLKIK